MLFKEIIGHKDIKDRLIQSVQKNRVSHALLFAGPEGNGKLALAIAYAQYVSCLNKVEGDSCGKCSSCVKYQKLIHPDLHFVYPVVRSTKLKNPISDDYLPQWRQFILNFNTHSLNKWFELINAENQQGGIFAQESHEIIRKLNLKTFEAEYKVMIIWIPEKMNTVSANKLLKMIEEPPPKTLFVLVSDFPEDMISTILSRCQLVKIPRINDSDMKEALIKKHGLNEDAALIILRLANGNYLKALDAIEESEETKDNFKMFTELMRNCYAYKVIETIGWIDNIATSGRERIKNFLLYALRLVRENFVLNNAEASPELNFLTPSEKEFSVKFSPFINERNVFFIAEQFEKAHFHIERNGYNKLVLLDMSLNLMKLLRK